MIKRFRGPGMRSGGRGALLNFYCTIINSNCSTTDIFLQFVGLIAGIIYFQTDINQSGITNVSGAIFFLLTSVTFNNVASVIFVSIREYHMLGFQIEIVFKGNVMVQKNVFFNYSEFCYKIWSLPFFF